MSQWTIDKRPTRLKDMQGLGNIKTYFYAKATEHDFPKAVLFRGQFGNGKSTSAKIIAEMMVCQNPDVTGDPCGECASCKAIREERYDRDVILIDGGQSGKAEVTEIISEFIATPPMFDKAKVIIIEEIQELSTAARNSLLKTLEHPRKNVHFILLSMQQGGSSGFASRCVPFNFKKVPIREIMMFLKKTMESEDLWESEEIPSEFKMQGLATIAQTSDGSLRQALQVLELCIIGKYFTADEIEENIGLVDETNIIKTLLLLLEGNDDVWPNLLKYEAMAFYAVAMKIISDAAIYASTGYLVNESNSFFINNNKKLVRNRENFDLLVDYMLDIGKIAKPFLRKSEMLALLAKYVSEIRSKQKQIKHTNKNGNGDGNPPNLRKLPIRTRGV